MNNGYAVLQWIAQNDYTVTSIANEIGIPRPKLSQALHKNHISIRIANLLDQHYGLQVIATAALPWQTENKGEQLKNQPARGRVSGRVEKSLSKLDQYAEGITELLVAGTKQKDVASRYGTTPSNLHAWMKRRGLLKKQRANRAVE